MGPSWGAMSTRVKTILVLNSSETRLSLLMKVVRHKANREVGAILRRFWYVFFYTHYTILDKLFELYPFIKITLTVVSKLIASSQKSSNLTSFLHPPPPPKKKKNHIEKMIEFHIRNVSNNTS